MPTSFSYRKTIMTNNIDNTVECPACGVNRVQQSFEQSDSVCYPCQKRYPASLLKASVDPFDYALKLITGEVVRFESASINGDYVHLEGVRSDDSGGLPYGFARGVDVRVDAIAWCADAPEGS
jgi:hypothetical protein